MSSVSGEIATLIGAGAFGQPPQPGFEASLGDYGILRRLGEGASGLVFLATRPGAGGQDREGKVAVKVLRPECWHAREVVERFLYSARTTRQKLNHPNIVRVLEVRDQPAGPCFVMSYCAGGSLAERLRRDGALPADTVLGLALDVAAALQHIHGQGLIHRDVKPGNILLTGDGRACLADFGLARTMFNDAVLDGGGHGEGTAPYMSPIVAAGDLEDTRCDIYAFGAVLYHLLTGRPPYEGRSSEEIRAKIRASGVSPRAVAEVNPKASRALAAVCAGAMARKQRDRYANMADVLADLRRIGAGQAPLGPHGEAWGWRRGGRWVAAAGMLVLVSALLWMFWPRPPQLVPVHRLELEEVSQWGHAQFGRWLGERASQLAVVNQDKLQLFSFHRGAPLPDGWPPKFGSAPVQALIREALPEVRLPVAKPNPARLAGFANVTGDPGGANPASEEVLVTFTDGDWVSLAAYGQQGVETRRYGFRGTLFTNDITENPQATGLMAETPRVLQLQGDRRQQLLAHVTTGRGLKPRGLACFDAGSSNLLWTHWIAPLPAGLEVMDLEGDGRSELLLGSYAVSNTNALSDGTTDHHCYLYALDDQGRTRHITVLGDDFTWCRPLAVRTNAGGSPRPYAWLTADEHLRGSPFLFPQEITNLTLLAGRLTAPTDALSRYLAGQLPDSRRRDLTKHQRARTGWEAVRTALASELNTLLQGGALYDADRFAGVNLSPEVRERLRQNPPAAGPERLRLHRLLLEEAYPDAISRLALRCKSSSPAASPVGRVVKLDGSLHVVGDYDARASLCSCRVLDLEGDGVDEILATDSWGTLHVLNHELTSRAKLLLTTNLWARADLTLVGFTNLVADGPPMLVFSSSQLELVHGGDVGNDRNNPTVQTRHHNEIILLDAALRTVLRHEVAPEWSLGPGDEWLRVVDVDGDGVSELVVLTDAVTMYRFR